MEKGRTWIKCLEGISEKIILVLQALSMLISSLFLLATALQVFRRYVLNSPIYGLDEWVICGMIWFSSLATVTSFWKEEHARIEYFLKFFPKWYRIGWNVMEYVSVIICGVIYIIGGKMLFKMQIRTAVLGGIPFSKAYYYATPMIVMGVLLIFFSLVRIAVFVFDKEAFEEIKRGGTNS